MPKIVLVVVIAAVVLVSGVYFWQNRTISDEQNYTNAKWKFSLDIPEGYLVQDEEDILYVVKKPTPDNETPSPEVRIKIKKGSQTTVDAGEGMTVVSEEKITINDIPGHKTVVSYTNYPDGNKCPFYRLQSGGVVYEFSLYECLESAIFEPVVQSFKII